MTKRNPYKANQPPVEHGKKEKRRNRTLTAEEMAKADEHAVNMRQSHIGLGAGGFMARKNRYEEA